MNKKLDERNVAEEEEQAGIAPIAALDLGSNSFHMIVARVIDGQIRVVDRLREMVQLGAGLDAQYCLSKEARDRALGCLERFSQRLRDMPLGSIRIVGTNTLRKAQGTSAFLKKAEAVLNHPIEIISGQEEARLIYLGVSHSIARDDEKRLVMDIGGGSTELIIGQQFDPLCLESLEMGCVSASRCYFSNGEVTQSSFRRAVIAAQLELRPIKVRYRKIGWDLAIGASGTIKAVDAVLQAAGWSEGGITMDALQNLRKEMLAIKKLKAMASLKGLKPERATVFPGGVAILIATFEALKIEKMLISDGALREGLLYDLIGRIQREDVREKAVQNISDRCHVDQAQAERVQRTALACLVQVAKNWDLGDETQSKMLRWAAGLHEMGTSIAHSQYQKHGGYLLEHADLPGFSREDQCLLAVLVRGHRRKIPPSIFQPLAEETVRGARYLCILLRLAVLLHRNRSQPKWSGFSLKVKKNTLEIKFAEGWLESHPLTQADLSQEAEYLQALDFKLEFC